MTTRINTRARLAPLAALCLALALPAARASAQFFPGDFEQDIPGVWIEQDGNVKSRTVDTDKELAAIRARARQAEKAAKDQKLSFVSLPKVFAQVRALKESGKDIPDELRYLGGLTQVRYVFVYPDEKDLVVAGPAEPFKVVGDGMYAIGTKSGRPVMQLDDLVVAMRTAASHRGRVFGCRIDPNPDSVEISKKVMQDHARSTRKERMAAMEKALGPQIVSVFGTAADTRLAFVLVAADYKLKRFAMGLEPAAAGAPGVGIGHAVDNSRSAMNRFWFEAGFDPMRVSPDGNAFEFRGPRLKVLAGAFSFDPRGATPKAMAFAKKFSDRMNAVAVAEPLVAELQNIADLSLLATLIRHDRLDRKAGWDAGWLMDDGTYSVKKTPAPATADTLVSATAGSIAAGGVQFNINPVLDNREPDDRGELDQSRRQVMKMRQGGSESTNPVWAQR